MSAFCCTRAGFLVNSRAPNSRGPSITARPAPDEKERFAELAASRGISESTLALIAIRALLESSAPPARTVPSGSRHQAATDRITIRLRPGDGRALNDRAARRRMKPRPISPRWSAPTSQPARLSPPTNLRV